MEILSETVHYGEFTFSMIVIVGSMLIFVGLLIVLILSMIFDKKVEKDSVLGSIIMLLLASILAYVLVSEINSGVKISYEATITDFNEVYNSGYKVTDQDGDIYTVEKVNNWNYNNEE